MDKDLLYNFYKGKVSIEEGQRVKAWVEASDENERAFYRERKIFDALMLNNPLPVKKTSFFNFTHYKKIEWLKIAMTVILTFLLSYFYQEYKAGLDSVAMSTISVPEGQRTNVTLPDGSNVWLNACTTIQYPTSFNSRERFVILKGEAYFDVKKDTRPFVVSLESGDVTVLGTSFGVSAYPGYPNYTTLVRGSVRFTSLRQEQVVLTPGEQAVVNISGTLEKRNVDVEEFVGWKDGVFIFKDKTLAEIMQILERWYGVNVIFQDESLKELEYTGSLERYDSINTFLQLLEKLKEIRYEIKKNTIVLFK